MLNEKFFEDEILPPDGRAFQNGNAGKFGKNSRRSILCRFEELKGS
jgi:hypothetical protein